MCGRFVDPNLRSAGLDTSWLKIAPFPRRFNVKPTQDVLILAKQPLVALMARWWLIPSWFDGADAKDWRATTFNARIEEAKHKPAFRAAWRFGRCLIPAAGYYEWTGAKGAKQPHFIRPAGNDETLYFAGLASCWQGLLTCTILTRAANDYTADLHPRQPVILDPEERDAWLDGTEDHSLGAGARLKHSPVRPFGTTDDGPALIE